MITVKTEIVNMPNELLDLIHQLLKNTLFNGHIPELVLSPKSHGYTSTIAGLLCHIGILLNYALGSGKENLLSPLTLIYMEPDKLNQRLFPTMKNMDSSVNSIKMAISEYGRWYECPNGHSYFIGEVSCYLQLHLNFYYNLLLLTYYLLKFFWNFNLIYFSLVWKTLDCVFLSRMWGHNWRQFSSIASWKRETTTLYRSYIGTSV